MNLMMALITPPRHPRGLRVLDCSTTSQAEISCVWMAASSSSRPQTSPRIQIFLRAKGRDRAAKPASGGARFPLMGISPANNGNRWHELRFTLWHGLPGEGFLEPVKAIRRWLWGTGSEKPVPSDVSPRAAFLVPRPVAHTRQGMVNAENQRPKRPVPTPGMREKSAQCVKSAARGPAKRGRFVAHFILSRVWRALGLDCRAVFHHGTD